MPENKHPVCVVMKAIAAELLLPSQEMVGILCMLVEQLRALSMFALSGPPKVSRVTRWCTEAQTASGNFLPQVL